MTPQRPPVLVVMAVLNFVFGGFGLVALLCLGAIALCFGSMASQAPPGPRGSPNPMQEMWGMYQSIPGFIPYTVVTSIMGLVMATLLIVAGIGLLKVRPWARVLCVIYSVYTILATIGGLIYSIAIVNPAIELWQQDLNRRMAGGGPPPPTMGGGANNVMSVAGSVMGMAYAIALLVVMFLPVVSAAFAGRSLSAREDPEDYYDEDRPRRQGPSRYSEDIQE